MGRLARSRMECVLPVILILNLLILAARLTDQQAHLENVILADVQPIYKRDADKSRGEIFPTVWYRSNLDVTSMQLSLLAKSVLVAENPSL